MTPPPPGAPPALNVLPSTIIGATSSLTGAGRLEVQMAYLYKFAQTPGFWQGLAAYQAGTASPTQLATVTDVTNRFRIPATQLQQLARGAGGALTVVSGYSFGASIGGGILDIVGFDRYGTVCTQTSGVGQAMVGILTGTSCDEFNAFQEGLVANAGVVPGLLGGTSCHSTLDYCVSLVRIDVETILGVAAWRFCFTASGSYAPAGNGSLPIQYSTTGVGYTSTNIARPGTFYGVCGGGLFGTGQSIAGSAVPIAYRADSGAPAVNPTMSSANPTRTLKCVVLGSDSNTYTKVGPPYTEADGVLPTPECPDLPPGVDVDTMTIYETYNGEDHQLWQEGTTPQYQDHQTSYPECAGGTCMLDLRTVAGVSCFQTPTECANWFADPNKADKFNCWYGTHAVDLAECNVYGPTFKPDAQTNGTPLGDPENGTQTQAPPGANPGADKDTFGQPVKEPTEQRQCFPTGWGVLNPVEWVTKPVQCALEWAFVPRPSQLTAAGTRITTAWNATAVARTATIVATIPEMLPEVGSDCLGPALSFDGLEDFALTGTYYPLQSCDEPMATFATVGKLFLTGVVAVSALLSVVRYLASIIGFTGFSGGKTE